ncbi:MAG TPA: ribosome biogenesis GTPase Der [Chitinivibrionales bacterium]|nr:ribosome biogenesis GTPase Der [Chitinivibrionales bacterium]
MESLKQDHSILPIVSIVGRPNVGKSCLFNRIIGVKAAVVDDVPGVTRDRNYRGTAWNGCAFSLVDTGGLIPASKDGMAQDIAKQVAVACEESDVILFLVDVRGGVCADDLAVARGLRKQAGDRVVLVINKCESRQTQYDTGAFVSLGLGEGHAVSALQGYGVGDLLDRVTAMLKAGGKKRSPSRALRDDRDFVKVAVVGRPNAGKSSLVNKLLGRQRMIVRPDPGTTRDSIDSEMTHRGRPMVLIDTAGLRKKANVKEDLEYYCNLRAIASIGRCDVAVLVVDAVLGIHEQDLRIVRQIVDTRKGLLLCWNKWDLVPKTHSTFDHLSAAVRAQYMELTHVPMVSASALTGRRVTAVLDRVLEIQSRMRLRVDAKELADLVRSWVSEHPHPTTANRQVIIETCVQADAPFPLFHLVATNPRNGLPNYKRFIANKLYNTYDFNGCPVVVDFVPIRKRARYNKEEEFRPSLKGDDVQ